MANSFPNLVADAYAALRVVNREFRGLLPTVTRNATADRLAIGQKLYVPIAPQATSVNVVPSMSLPSEQWTAINNIEIEITNQKAVRNFWTGEDQYALDTGAGFANIRQQEIAQAFRTLTREMSESVYGAAAVAGTRAYGTAGTAPFATSLADAAELKKILDDNGTPQGDRHLLIDTTASCNLRKLTQLTNVNQAGTDGTLRQGVLYDLFGFAIREDAAITSRVSGTGSAYVLDGALAKGATTIKVKTGTGTILAGDVVTIGASKYVVKTALASSEFTIEAPGLATAAADAATVTVNAASVRNLAYSRDALLLATRLPVNNANTLATYREVIQDEYTGISFELRAYGGYEMGMYEIAVNWGVGVPNPQNIAQLLG